VYELAALAEHKQQEPPNVITTGRGINIVSRALVKLPQNIFVITLYIYTEIILYIWLPSQYKIWKFIWQLSTYDLIPSHTFFKYFEKRYLSNDKGRRKYTKSEKGVDSIIKSWHYILTKCF
jgi:hypothetical protein